MDELNRNETYLSVRPDIEILPYCENELQNRETRPEEINLTSPQQAVSQRWCVFDAISRQSYRIGWVEHWVLQESKDRVSSVALAEKFHSAFPNAGLSRDNFLQSVAYLQSIGILQTSGAITRNWKTLDQHYASNSRNFSSLLFIRIRGIQPDRCLCCIAPFTDFLFSRWGVKFWIVSFLLTVGYLLLNFQQLSNLSTSAPHEITSSLSWQLFAVFLITRALHELGHALVCTRFGIRCPDMGVFLILGAPCVYCDVSECWKLRHWWQRAAVAAGGIYVELIVATIATWIWLLTTDGNANTIAFQTMLICSISTIVVNANPLMRFDGYYILSDLFNEVNLRERANTILAQTLLAWSRLKWFRNSELSLARQLFFCLFSVASSLYRIALAFLIAGVISSALTSWNFIWLGRMAGITVVFAGVALPMLKKILSPDKAARSSSRKRLAWSGLGIVMVAIAVVPIPNRQFAVGWIEPTESTGIFAQHSGQLKEIHTDDGEHVSVDQRLFEIESSAAQVQQIIHRKQWQQALIAKQHRDYAKQSRAFDSQDLDREPIELKRLAQHADRQIEELTLRSPITGHLVAMPALESTEFWQSSRSPKLTSWSDTSNLRRFIPKGTLLAAVCKSRSQAVFVLERNQIADIAINSEVRIALPSNRYAVYQGTVRGLIPYANLDSLWKDYCAPQELIAGNPNRPSNDSAHGKYAAIVELPEDFAALPGASAEAVFVGQPASLARHFYRFLQTDVRLFDE